MASAKYGRAISFCLALFAFFDVAAAAVPTEREIKSGALGGAYIDAGEGAPIVLIVPGSGPTDRDGNSPAGIKANSYKLLAEALGKRGVSTVRVDKRGMFSSAGAGDPNAVTVDIYANDYRGWADKLAPDAPEKCIFLLGHSEGAIMVTAAGIDQDNICGLMLIAGPGRPFGDILREQLKANPANAPILEQAFSAIDALEAGERVDVSALHPALRGLFFPAVQDFLISLMSVDPAALAARADLPTLIIQGDRDLQVSIKDAELLHDAVGGQLEVIEGVNHVLKKAPAERGGNLATYADPDLPVADEVVNAIACFVSGC